MFVIISVIIQHFLHNINASVYMIMTMPFRIGTYEHHHMFTVAIGRVIFAALGCLMLGTLIYSFITLGSPFHKDVMTP